MAEREGWTRRAAPARLALRAPTRFAVGVLIRASHPESGEPWVFAPALHLPET